MSYQLTWMLDELQRAGLKVAEHPGWRDRGRAEMGTVRGVMVHHTGTAAPGNMPTLTMLAKGRADPPLRGPLANLGLGRDGTFYLVAAGRANHAGDGGFRNIVSGNASFIGIEAEHSGRPEDPWPAAQMEAYQRGVAALLGFLHAPADMCIAHKEWAPGRKVDPCFDMQVFREAVHGYLTGRTSPPPPVPTTDNQGRPTLRRGDEGPSVRLLQDALDIRADGIFGAKTEAALRSWQRGHQLDADGICGPKTWAALTAPHPANPVVVAVPNGGHVLSAAGVTLIHSFEGCARRQADGTFRAYPDPGSRDGRPWTIGWGSTGAGIDRDTVWSQRECDDHFNQRIQRYVSDVNRALNGAKTTQNQFDALVSFHYNTGKIADATLTRRHCSGQYDAAVGEFARWVRNDGKVMAGLVRRRQAEADLYATAGEGAGQ